MTEDLMRAVSLIEKTSQKIGIRQSDIRALRRELMRSANKKRYQHKIKVAKEQIEMLNDIRNDLEDRIEEEDFDDLDDLEDYLDSITRSQGVS